jgi:hypothetical protein
MLLRVRLVPKAGYDRGDHGVWKTAAGQEFGEFPAKLIPFQVTEAVYFFKASFIGQSFVIHSCQGRLGGFIREAFLAKLHLESTPAAGAEGAPILHPSAGKLVVVSKTILSKPGECVLDDVFGKLVLA